MNLTLWVNFECKY